MRLSAAATVGIVLGFCLGLSACGEEGSTAASDPARTASPPQTGAARRNAPPPAEARSSCRRELGPLVVSLTALRQDLARGLSYDDYLARVGGIRGVYAKVRPKHIPPACLVMSGGPAESAFNLYIGAANLWGDCLATVTCDTRSIEPQLQRRWARAEHRLALAQRGLRPVRNG